ncbi:BZ3500_MvSof-1268-A1-R1_Chr3-1g05705 [Microbotryum saponariae]|uniref:BZ3500_MvSof-1268-A1-R1_Chr3-1g05705 protein n=1 Tax=Microbotryum saponariae TaxID=289078 RepID=A0A2X0M6P3_9BASI|nr:BZ3500_MvSof-1268-A1-R1_Chr3-1g05705 [Microbotryum saponariae]SDA04895.1 BZ3501_MvSof-1269-A2-R1_Chr3-1g05375 [Microbotryum saponariae]
MAPSPPSSSTAVVPSQQQEALVKKKKMVKRPPARRQVEVGQVVKKAPEQTGSTFNVWYHKWAGGDKYDEYNVKEKSQTRVDLKKDSGYTKADGDGTKYLCLFFARGCCPLGHECSYLHRLPPSQHELPDASLDVFGREKHSDYRDDMGGVGSFTRMNRTLYIGRLVETRDTAEMIERHFEEFGEIERSQFFLLELCSRIDSQPSTDSHPTLERLIVKILSSRGVAFVTYVSELNAQFAKEAMMHQSLDSDEILNVRWATEDPNPAAKRRNRRELEQAGEDGIAATLDPEFVRRVRELDELEGLVEPLPAEMPEIAAARDEEPDEEEEGRQNKRARIEAPPTPTTGTQNGAHDAVKAGGILSANAIDSLKYIASLRQATAAPTSKTAAPPTPANALGGLAAYGSDEESD